MPNPGITKPNTVETFMKAHATLRVGVDAVAALVEQLNLLAADIVKDAEANATKAERTTILAADITAAMTTITGSRLELRRFGIFAIKHQAPRLITLPSGKKITVPAQKTVSFTPSPTVKKKLNPPPPPKPRTTTTRKRRS